MRTKSKPNKVRKFLASVLLAPVLLGTIGFTYSIILQVHANAFAASENKSNIETLKTQVGEIHWYLIDRNNVQVPKTIKEKSRE